MCLCFMCIMQTQMDRHSDEMYIYTDIDKGGAILGEGTENA